MIAIRYGLYGLVSLAIGAALAALLLDGGSLLLGYHAVAIMLPTWSDALYFVLPLAAVVLAWPWADELRGVVRYGLSAVQRLKRDTAMAMTQHTGTVPRQQTSYGPVWA
ncbi:MAG: hypothetical protein KBC46_03555 [Ferrovibrio sp.]|nr:hypothetical protein [Ferrovibrio sp.]